MKKARNIAFFRVIRAIRVQKICGICEICVTCGRYAQNISKIYLKISNSENL